MRGLPQVRQLRLRAGELQRGRGAAILREEAGGDPRGHLDHAGAAGIAGGPSANVALGPTGFVSDFNQLGVLESLTQACFISKMKISEYNAARETIMLSTGQGHNAYRRRSPRCRFHAATIVQDAVCAPNIDGDDNIAIWSVFALSPISYA